MADLLEDGKPVWIPVQGFSMLFALWPGDLALIKPLESQLSIGDIVLYRDKLGRLFLHRVVALQNENGSQQWLLEGDGASLRQDLVEAKQILGRAVAVNRSGKMRDLSSTSPARWVRWAAFVTVFGFRLWHKLRSKISARPLSQDLG